MPEHADKNQDLSLKQFDLSNCEDNVLNLPNKYVKSVKDLVKGMESTNDTSQELAQKAISFLEQANGGIAVVNANSSSFGRFWGTITGSTEKQHITNEAMLANAQKACVQLILEMNKQFLLSQEQILMLQCQIRSIVVENNEFRQKLFQRLSDIFEAVDSRFRRIEKVIRDAVDCMEDHENRLQRIEAELSQQKIAIIYLDRYLWKVEKELQTLLWVNTIDVYAELNYEKRNEVELLIQILHDFHILKNGQYTYTDLLLLIKAMKQIGYDLNTSVSIKSVATELHKYLSKNKKDIEMLEKRYKIDYTLENKSKFITPFIFVLTQVFYHVKHDKTLEITLQFIEDKHEYNLIEKSTSWQLIAFEFLNHLTEPFMIPPVDTIKPPEIIIESKYGKICNGYVNLRSREFNGTPAEIPDSFNESVRDTLRYYVKFERPFKVTPIIHIGLTFIDSISKGEEKWAVQNGQMHDYIRVQVWNEDTDENGFYICIHKWLSTYYYGIGVNWLAIAID
jgi:hypothetical protein